VHTLFFLHEKRIPAISLSVDFHNIYCLFVIRSVTLSDTFHEFSLPSGPLAYVTHYFQRFSWPSLMWGSVNLDGAERLAKRPGSLWHKENRFLFFVFPVPAVSARYTVPRSAATLQSNLLFLGLPVPPSITISAVRDNIVLYDFFSGLHYNLCIDRQNIQN